MRKNIRNFLAEVTQVMMPPSPIVEIGSYRVKGQEELANLRPLFPDSKYIGTDMRKGPGVDRIENAEYLNFEDHSLGGLVSIDTLQCVRNIWKARDEMFRVLAPNGLLFIASAMNAPYSVEYFYNYWRFTPKGFDLLMDKFPHRMMFLQGDQTNPHTLIGLASQKHEVMRPFENSSFLEKVKTLGEEPFCTYDVNALHAQILADDIEKAQNV